MFYFQSSTTIGGHFDASTGSSTRQPSPSSARRSEQEKDLDSGSQNGHVGVKNEQKIEEFHSSSEEAITSASSMEARKKSSTPQGRKSKSGSRSASLVPPKNSAEVPDSPTTSLLQQPVECQKLPAARETKGASRKWKPPSLSATATDQRAAVDCPPSSLPKPAAKATLVEHSTQTERRSKLDSLPGNR